MHVKCASVSCITKGNVMVLKNRCVGTAGCRTISGGVEK